MTAKLRTVRFLAAALFLLGSTVPLAAQNASSEAASSSGPAVVFHPNRPKPAPPGDVSDPETLLTPPPGFRIQRRNNFYRLDEKGGLYRWASTGHWSNYDEAEAGDYTLPDPLVLSSGDRVTDAKAWFEKRRPEIVRLYESEIYGKVPASAPPVTWHVISSENDGATLTKEIFGQIADGPDRPAEQPAGARGRGGRGGPIPAPSISISLTLPANAKGPIPVIFGVRGSHTQAVLDKGWGYGSVNTRNVQRDSADLSTLRTGVVGMTLKVGESRLADEWGVLRAWAWGLSRAMDYLETDPHVDATQIALSGHSRGGKMVLLAAAMDERIAMVFPTCSGEMGASVSRRDWGETIDDMAQLFAPHFAGNFTKYAGRWDDLPVDAHMLIALVAPRPVFLTGGTTDQWSDPKGQFESAVGAGPVYRLLGKKDLGVTEMPAPDTPLVAGDLAFHEHTGGHTVTETEWDLFLEFADRYFEVRNQ